jgi:hypothetical protein
MVEILGTLAFVEGRRHHERAPQAAYGNAEDMRLECLDKATTGTSSQVQNASSEPGTVRARWPPPAKIIPEPPPERLVASRATAQ